jgi:PGF-CTERM protein
MRRYAALCVAVLLVAGGIGTVPVAGHGNHLSADPQVVDDQVVFERAFLLADGYAVVHIDQGGSMGPTIGHTALSAGPHSNVAISVDEEFLSQIDGTAKVWVTLHRSDQDGEFDPTRDTPLTGIQGEPAGSVIPIRVSSDGNVNVAAQNFGSQRIDEAALEIPYVESNASGYLAVTAPDGSVVGSTSVAAGVTRNVTVDLTDEYFTSMPSNDSQQLTATMYRGDGDGSFDPETSRPVVVGGERVQTEFSVEKVQNASRTTSIVITAAGTTPPTASPATDSATTGASTPDSDGSMPGFGVGVAALALLAVTALARRR